MSDSYVIYVCDTETTGLDINDHEIIELSLYRLNLEDPSKDEQKTWLLRALKPETITAEALKINGHIREDVLGLTEKGKKEYRHPIDVLTEIEAWIGQDDMSANDRVMAGQNVAFDYDRMISLWKRHDSLDTFPFTLSHNRLILDTLLLTIMLDVCMSKKREAYNLGSLIKAFGIKKEKAHRADADVRMTKDLLVKIIKELKPACKVFEDCF